MKDWISKHKVMKFQSGGNIKEIKSDNPYMDYYHAQATYTKALANKYPNIPVMDILKQYSEDPNFNHNKINDYVKDIQNKYGDFYLDEYEIKNLIDKGYPDIINLDSRVKFSDSNIFQNTIGTKGTKEDSLGKFGIRMMLQKSFPKGSPHYKVLGSLPVMKGGGIVAGVDITKWATAPKHEETINNVYNKISEHLSYYKDSDLMEEGINEYIQNNPVVKKQGGSPVSAKMILNTAKKYNVDPALIMSIAQVDSHFGTIGKAKRTRNPGNWGNDDAGNIVTFDTWDEGINVIGRQLDKWKTSDYVTRSKAEYDPVPNVDEVVLPIYENLPKKKPIKQEVIDIEPFHNFFDSLIYSKNNKKDNLQVVNPTLKSLQSKIDQSGFINLNYR